MVYLWGFQSEMHLGRKREFQMVKSWDCQRDHEREQRMGPHWEIHLAVPKASQRDFLMASLMVVC